jgi:hypothetical protein
LLEGRFHAAAGGWPQEVTAPAGQFIRRCGGNGTAIQWNSKNMTL